MNKNDISMICSVDFADWMKDRYFSEVSQPKDNLDMVLRYCSGGYRELYEEEERKANEFFYQLKLEDDQISMSPSYKVTRLCALDPVSQEPSREYLGIVEAYSVLTTCSAFPGRQQFPISKYLGKKMWNIPSLIWEAMDTAEKLQKRYSIKDWKKRMRIYDPSRPCDKLIISDSYKVREFERALDAKFVDNEWPYSLGPSCPDRIFSDGMKENVLRHLMRDFYSICRERGIRREYMEIYCLALTCEWMKYGYHCGEKDISKVSIQFSKLCRLADQSYKEFSEKFEVEKLDEMSFDLYIMMISTIERRILDLDRAKIEHFDAEGILQMRDHALDAYITPQERFGM